MFDLTGRTAARHRATGGIGGAIAQALHAQGATVAISGTRREVLDTLAAKLGERVHVLPCNLSDSAEVERWFRLQNRRLARSTFSSPTRASPATSVRAIARRGLGRGHQVNVDGDLPPGTGRDQADDAQALRPLIAITSIVGVTQSGAGNYTAVEGRTVRHGSRRWSRVRQTQRHANCIAPGFIATPMTDALNDKQREANSFKSFLRRGSERPRISRGGGLSQPNEAAMSRQTIHVNGGMAMI